jgi:hypothetical protein
MKTRKPVSSILWPFSGALAAIKRQSRRRWHRPRWLLLVMVLALPLIGALREWFCQTRVAGIVTAVPGGDLVRIGETHIRLEEIVVQAPSQAGPALRFMESEILGQWVSCRGCQREAGATVTGWCVLKDGSRLGQRLVEAGLARDCPAISGGHYAAFQVGDAASIPLPDRCRPWIRRGPRPPVR